ncbi:zf-C3HC-domain-containing protein [Rhizodiscina lignyota]|uniref:Zf-C3HC-domain-containing protein n=1 Tax=Rhizodiscina lignyota TaxID=1504668 RepID=A0A9P4IB63_9PEZI|nr:zf-C3HC-domain-containing protein [Rhizodiscina lignyota]
MAPALQTSKRKFYKLLDGLNTSQSSLSTRQTNKAGASTTTLNARPDEPAAKRSRLSLDSTQSQTQDTRPSSVRIVGPSTSAFAKASTRPSTSATNSKTPPRPTPNYQPFSQPAFLDRLKTFSDVKLWTYKPSEISELHWAKRGWVCDSKEVDVVACKGGCEARVVVRLRRGRERAEAFERLNNGGNSDDASKEIATDKDVADGEGLEIDWMDEADNPLVARYKDLIIEGHHEGCLWKKAGCKDDIYRIRMADASTWQTELTERYSSLVAIGPALPEMLKFPDADAETGDEQRTIKFTIDNLRSSLFSIMSMAQVPAVTRHDTASSDSGTILSEKDLDLTAVSLSLFGWQGTSPHKIHLATCSRCFQRIGLWLYTSNPSNKALPASQSGIADDNIMRFDLVGLHRDHCPWINGETQAGLGQFAGLPAWEILVQLIKGSSLRRTNVEAGQSEEVEVMDEGDTGSMERSREEVEAEDRARDSKFARLKRAFTIKKGNKAENRKSWKSGKSVKG